MNTIIIMWNPETSDFHLKDLKNNIRILRYDADEMTFLGDDEKEGTEYVDLSWHFSTRKKIGHGDRFYMVRGGEGKTGIVMSGTLQSNPYENEGWKENEHARYSCDLHCECIIDTECAPHISIQDLMEAIPEIDWTNGNDGIILDEKQAFTLEKMWAEYVYKYFRIFDAKRAGKNFPANYIPNRLAKFLTKTGDDRCEICGYSNNNHFVRYIPRRTDIRCKNGDTVWDHIHCICGNCGTMSYEMLAQKLGEKDYIDEEKNIY